MGARNKWLMATAVPLLSLLFALPTLALDCTWTQREDIQNFANPIYTNIAIGSIVPPSESQTKNGKHHNTFFVPAGTPLAVACPGSSYAENGQPGKQFPFAAGSNSFIAHCSGSSGKFRVEFFNDNDDDLGLYACGSGFEFNHEILANEAACPAPLTLISTGFTVDNSRLTNSFRHHVLINCYGEAKKKAIYVKHKWFASKAKPAKVQSSWASVFNDKKNLEVLYDTDWHIGHLAPAADFKLLTPKLATYIYENAAPQLGCLNAGQWKLVEDRMRRNFNFATIYTGTHGDGTRNGQENVRISNLWRPLAFWKIVVGFDNANQPKVKGYFFLNGMDSSDIMNQASKFFGKDPDRYVLGVTAGYSFEGLADMENLFKLPEARYVKEDFQFKDFVATYLSLPVSANIIPPVGK